MMRGQSIGIPYKSQFPRATFAENGCTELRKNLIRNVLIQNLHLTFSIFLASLDKVFIRTQVMISDMFIRSIIYVVDSVNAMLNPPKDYVFLIKADQERHETVQALQNMIDIDGAGSWPPKASHRDSWPIALHPYHDIFLELSSLLPADNVSTDDAINYNRRLEYRTRLKRLLKERISIAAVKSVLSISDSTDSSILRGDACNGFFACIANMRHAFR